MSDSYIDYIILSIKHSAAVDLVFGKPNIFLVCNGNIYPIPKIGQFEFSGEFDIKSQKDLNFSPTQSANKN